MNDKHLTEQFEAKFSRYVGLDTFPIYKSGYLLGLGKLDELKEMIEKEIELYPLDWNFRSGYEKVLEMIEQIKKESEKE